ncbi:MAG: hypothetical protein ACOY3Y_19570 [Acidobacteriota bacterium]
MPETELERARRHLAGRGYLKAAPGKRPHAPLRAVAAVVVLACAAAAVTAGVLARLDRAPAGIALLLAVALLPAWLAGLGVGAWLGRVAARTLLRLGGSPEAIAAALAVLAALAVAAGVSAPLRAAAGNDWTVLLRAVVLTTALAVATACVARKAVMQALEYRESRSSGHAWALAIAVALGTAGGLVVADLATVRARPVGADPVEAFPPPVGKVAVIAVDGLAREDLESLEGRDTLAGLSAVRSWGWAPLKGHDTRLPAVLWTTVACGVEPAVHGVEEIEEVRLFGVSGGLALPAGFRWIVHATWSPLGLAELVARPALQRNVPTFWEMASRAGCPVSVGGWWSSWPVRRVLGEVVSERAWLGGGSDADAVTPGMAEAVRDAWRGGVGAVEASERLAVAVAERASRSPSPHLVAVWMPGPDLLQRTGAASTPLALARATIPRLESVSSVLDTLRRGEYRVLLVAVPWHGGTAFVSASWATAGDHAELSAVDLAPTVLDMLGLPVPEEAPPPRRDLSSVSGRLTRGAYGPPPQPLAAPPASSRAVQRDVLRSLGYLR